MLIAGFEHSILSLIQYKTQISGQEVSGYNFKVSTDSLCYRKSFFQNRFLSVFTPGLSSRSDHENV